MTDARQHASKKLRYADDALMHQHGIEGLSLVRDVLCERRAPNQCRSRTLLAPRNVIDYCREDD